MGYSPSIRVSLLFFAVLIPVLACGTTGRDDDPGAPARDAGLRVRRPVDEVGYTHSAEGIAAVVAHAGRLEARELEAVADRLRFDEDTIFKAAVSPHDDYAYAQQAYIHVFPRIKARHVILVGVAHKARDFPHTEGRLVFDTHDRWAGPHGGAAVSPLRAAIKEALPGEDWILEDALHAKEHSLEGLLPWLLHFDRDVRIVPILVPYMTWERLDGLARRFAAVLDRVLAERDLVLGRDVALVISSDSVHYGDEGWGGRSYADFGVDEAGYARAVDRDLGLVRDHLAGVVTTEKLEGFYRKVVADDCHEYRITWCGRFSIPFGLSVLAELARRRGEAPPRGDLLRYATTLDPGRSDPGVEGLGVTAPASLRHWVGFAAVGYR